MAKTSEIIEMTVDIVSAYVSQNPVGAVDLPSLIQSVHAAIAGVCNGGAEQPAAPQVPAAPVRKSISHEHLICLEDGRQFKSLKRHLKTKFNLSPEEYRAKWGLPADYPMVAPSYAAARSRLAKSMGLGRARAGEATTKTNA
jgi:predicted transcriptional regulator